MDFFTAKTSLCRILDSLTDDARSKFHEFCKVYFSYDSSISKTYFDLRTIAEDIKTLMPIEAILPTEQVNHSKMDDQAPVIHVDSFLYEDDHIDELAEEGKLNRNYCKACGSVDVAPITFISHSTSVKRLDYIFKYILPDLSNKVLLDVGSRLGAVLYGAYYCSAASKIIGVEFNLDLCKLQNHIIDKYGLNDRIQVICNDICAVPEVIQAADVILCNNVFECFMTKETQENTWKWLRNHITKPGTILVTVPSIETTLANLETGIDVPTWLRKVSGEDSENVLMDDEDLTFGIFSYIVI